MAGQCSRHTKGHTIPQEPDLSPVLVRSRTKPAPQAWSGAQMQAASRRAYLVSTAASQGVIDVQTN